MEQTQYRPHYDYQAINAAPAAPGTETPPVLVREAVEGFLFDKALAHRSAGTLQIYGHNLRRFTEAVGAELASCNHLVVQQYLADLKGRGLKPASIDQHFRTLKTFFRWAMKQGFVSADPISPLTRPNVPDALPWVPDAGDVSRLLDACPDTWEGLRNRALVALLVDSGLRISEALQLHVEDIHFLPLRTITVRNGKGQKGRIAYFDVTAAQYLRVWLKVRVAAQREDWLFCTQAGRPLRRRYAAEIMYRLSVRAGLPRKINPHALRHFAATHILRKTGDLDLVRRVLGHSSLTMALRYARLTGADVSMKFAQASPLNALRVGQQGQQGHLTDSLLRRRTPLR